MSKNEIKSIQLNLKYFSMTPKGNDVIPNLRKYWFTSTLDLKYTGILTITEPPALSQKFCFIRKVLTLESVPNPLWSRIESWRRKTWLQKEMKKRLIKFEIWAWSYRVNRTWKYGTVVFTVTWEIDYRYASNPNLNKRKN